MAATASILTSAAILLVVAGAQKVVDPKPAAGALRAAGFPVPATAIQVVAFVEVLIGTTVLITGAPAAVALLSASYVGFGGFVLVALRRGTMVSSCGCFGHVDTPPSYVHVAVNAGLAVASAAWIITNGSLGPLSGLADAPGAGVPFVILTALLTVMIYVSLTDLPRLEQAVGRSLESRSAR